MKTITKDPTLATIVAAASGNQSEADPDSSGGNDGGGHSGNAEASAGPSVVKLGKEVIRATTQLSRAAVAFIKGSNGMSRCVRNPDHNRLIAQHKDPRSLFIDVMKVIKLDEGGSSFLPAISNRIRADLEQAAKKAGYTLPDDLVAHLSASLAETELHKYMDRMFEIRKYVSMRLNEVLRRNWVLNHGDVTVPDNLFIVAKQSDDEDAAEA